MEFLKSVSIFIRTSKTLGSLKIVLILFQLRLDILLSITTIIIFNIIVICRVPSNHLEELSIGDEVWHFHREKGHKATRVLMADKAGILKSRGLCVLSSELAKGKHFQHQNCLYSYSPRRFYLLPLKSRSFSEKFPEETLPPPFPLSQNFSLTCIFTWKVCSYRLDHFRP